MKGEEEVKICNNNNNNKEKPSWPRYFVIVTRNKLTQHLATSFLEKINLFNNCCNAISKFHLFSWIRCELSGNRILSHPCMNNETARADPTHRQVVSAGWRRKSLEPLWFYILVLGIRCTDHMCNSQIYKTGDKSLRILEDCMLNCMRKNDRKNPCWQYPTLFLIAWDLPPLGGALRKALMTHKDRNATRLWSPTRLQYPVDLGTVRVCECEAEKWEVQRQQGRKEGGGAQSLASVVFLVCLYSESNFYNVGDLT